MLSSNGSPPTSGMRHRLAVSAEGILVQAQYLLQRCRPLPLNRLGHGLSPEREQRKRMCIEDRLILPGGAAGIQDLLSPGLASASTPLLQ
jgi:hypothetical protein